MMIKGYEITAKLIAILIGVLLIVLAVTLGPAACQKIRSLEAQSRMNNEQGAAYGNSAADAVNTTANAGRREANSEELTRTNEREIMAADGAHDAIKPGVSQAARNALCRRDAYKNDPECKGAKP